MHPSPDWQHAHLFPLLHRFVSIFNDAFALGLQTYPVINFEDLSAQGSYGCYRRRAESGEVQHIITIGTNGLDRDLPNVLGTLLHECLHQWQHERGTPAEPPEHNEEFRAKAAACGLNVTADGVTAAYTSIFTDVLQHHGVIGAGSPAPPAMSPASAGAGRAPRTPYPAARHAVADHFNLTRRPNSWPSHTTEGSMSQQSLVPTLLTQPISFKELKGLSRQQRSELKRQCQELLRIGLLTAIGMQAIGKLHDMAMIEYNARVVVPMLGILEQHDLGLVSDRQLAQYEAHNAIYERGLNELLQQGVGAIAAQVRCRSLRG